MSLNWSIANCKNWELLVEEGNEEVWTTSLVWGCMATGVNEIRIDNASEFYARMKMLEARAPWVQDKDAPVPLSPDVVAARIGLSTNVSDESRKDWLERQNRYEKENPLKKSEFAEYVKEFDAWVLDRIGMQESA